MMLTPKTPREAGEAAFYADEGNIPSCLKAAFDAYEAADTWREVAKRAGLCMTCALGAPEPYGCTDCLNTGWDGGAPRGYAPTYEAANGWMPIETHQPPHDVPVLLYSPPSMARPNGEIEARPFSTGRSGIGWSEYSEHAWATHWRPLPTPPALSTSKEG